MSVATTEVLGQAQKVERARVMHDSSVESNSQANQIYNSTKGKLKKERWYE